MSSQTLMSRDFLQGFTPVSPALPVREESPVREELLVREDWAIKGLELGARRHFEIDW